GRVAGACGGPAYGRALGVARAVRARAGARLGDVAVPGRGAAHGSGGLEAVGGAPVVHTVAKLGVVAGAGRRPAVGRALGIGGAVRARAGAEVVHVAHAGRGPAERAARRERVRRTVVLDAVAALGGVAGACGGPALSRALGIGGAAGARAGAEVVHVAHAGGGPAERAARREGVRRTVVLDPVAALGGVARACGEPAFGRALGVGGAVRARAGAEIVHVARAGGGPAERAARREGVRRTVVLDPITALGGVAGACRRAAS